MIKFILGLILVIGIGACVGVIVKNINKSRDPYANSSKAKAQNTVAGVIAVILVAIFITVPMSIHTVDAGTIAVVKEFGRAVDTRPAGMHFDFWITREYVTYDLTVQQEDIITTAYSSDAQTMDVEMVLQYQIMPDHAIDIINNYGSLVALSNRIKNIAIDKAKVVLSSKSAMNIIETRSTISGMIENAIKETVVGDYYVNITTVVLTNIDFSDAFETTVEEKMIAEQQKLKAQYEKEKAIIQAEQKLEVAKLDAEGAIAKANGEAKSRLAIASAEAKAIQAKSIEIARMLGFNIAETVEDGETTYTIDFTGKSIEEIKVISDYLKYVEYLSKWDGTLPETYVTGEAGADIMIPVK